MNCFNHNELPAIGLCPACNKALCQDCISSEQDYIYCNKEACQNTANTIRRIIANSPETQKTTNRWLKLSNIDTMATSLFFLIVGGLFLLESDIAFGATFFSFGLIILGLGLKTILSKKLKYPEI